MYLLYFEFYFDFGITASVLNSESEIRISKFIDKTYKAIRVNES